MLDMNSTASLASSEAEAVRGWRPGSFALRDAWFPIAHLPQIGRRPIARAIHEQPYFLWRDGEKIRAAEFHPQELAQRRNRASEFTAGSGEYPLLERYGYAWVWYGNPTNADAALMPDIPYLPRVGKVARHQWGSVLFDCTYELTCENLLDLTHADFVHSKIVGDSLSDDDTVSVESTSETVTMIREARGRTVPVWQRKLVGAERQNLRAVTHIHLRSGVIVIHGLWEPGVSVRLFHPDVPESPTRTRMNYTFNNAAGNIAMRNAFPLLNPIITRQDNRWLKAQNPRYLNSEFDERADFSSRFDGGGLAYRRRYNALVQRQQQGDFSYQADCDPGADISALLGVQRIN